MGLSRVAKACQECRYSEACNHKRMEALAYIDEPMMANVSNAIGATVMAPVLAKHGYRDIKIDADTTITIDLEEMKRELNRSLMPQLFQLGG